MYHPEDNPPPEGVKGLQERLVPFEDPEHTDEKLRERHEAFDRISGGLRKFLVRFGVQEAGLRTLADVDGNARLQEDVWARLKERVEMALGYKQHCANQRAETLREELQRKEEEEARRAAAEAPEEEAKEAPAEGEEVAEEEKVATEEEGATEGRAPLETFGGDDPTASQKGLMPKSISVVSMMDGATIAGGGGSEFSMQCSAWLLT